MYYDTGLNKFQCYENGAYTNCTGSSSTPTLQSAYDTGNLISTTNNRDMKITLTDTATDSNFIVNIASGSTGAFKIQGAGSDTFTVNGTGQTLFKNAANNTTAFQIQNAAGSNLFSIDTFNNLIVVGVPSASPTILVLGTKNTTGDPTCTNGGIYYNSASNQAKICINGAWTALGVPEVAALPGSPSDGDEVYYVADATNNIKWHLKYKTSASKWEFLGGNPMMATVATQESFNAGGPVDLATVGPSITVPLTGSYRIRYGADAASSAIYTTPWIQLSIGGLADATTKLYINNGTYAGTGAAFPITKSITASQVVKLQYGADNGQGGYTDYDRYRWIEITPISF